MPVSGAGGPREVLAPFREHELLDLQEKHASISCEAYVGLGPLGLQQQRLLEPGRRVHHGADDQQAVGQFTQVGETHVPGRVGEAVHTLEDRVARGVDPQEHAPGRRGG